MAPKPVDWGSVVRAILRHLLFWAVVVTYFAWGFGIFHPNIPIFETSKSFICFL